MITTKKILSLVSLTFGVTVNEIQSKSRIREVSDARKATAYLCSKHLKMLHGDIALQVKRDDNHVNYLLNQADSLLRLNKSFKNNIQTIENGMMGKCCPTCKRPL